VAFVVAVMMGALPSSAAASDDACTNIPGDQWWSHPGLDYATPNTPGDCTPKPGFDQCSNWPGIQGWGEVATRYVFDGSCDGDPAIDRCGNIPWVQTVTPEGFVRYDDGSCQAASTSPGAACWDDTGVHAAPPAGSYNDFGQCRPRPSLPEDGCWNDANKVAFSVPVPQYEERAPDGLCTKPDYCTNFAGVQNPLIYYFYKMVVVPNAPRSFCRMTDHCTNLANAQPTLPKGTTHYFFRDGSGWTGVPVVPGVQLPAPFAPDARGSYVCYGGNKADRVQLPTAKPKVRDDYCDNTFLARAGNDHVIGSPYRDCIQGGPGNDNLVGGKGRDGIDGNAGNDTINLRDGSGGDGANCGPGRDTAIVDRGDTTAGCERVLKPRR
jgi:hypothetical protein